MYSPKENIPEAKDELRRRNWMEFIHMANITMTRAIHQILITVLKKQVRDHRKSLERRDLWTILKLLLIPKDKLRTPKERFLTK